MRLSSRGRRNGKTPPTLDSRPSLGRMNLTRPRRRRASLSFKGDGSTSTVLSLHANPGNKEKNASGFPTQGEAIGSLEGGDKEFERLLKNAAFRLGPRDLRGQSFSGGTWRAKRRSWVPLWEHGSVSTRFQKRHREASGCRL